MKTFKEFLESSTIHGLVYISISRSFVRIFWIFVVFIGFTGAVYLINQSFSSWANSPVATTIATKPITDLELPNVIVCPPRNSFTSLNPDLVRARGVKLGEAERKELVDSVPDSVYDSSLNAQYLDFLQYRKNTGQDKYRDWYMGASKVNLPSRDPNTAMYSYSFDTTKLTGHFTSPDFGQPFDRNSFASVLRTRLYITVSREIHNKLIAGQSIIMEIEYDIEGDVEYIRVEEQLREMTDDEINADKYTLVKNEIERTSYQTNPNVSFTVDPNSRYRREEFSLYVKGDAQRKQRSV